MRTKTPLYTMSEMSAQYERVKGAGRATPREWAIIRELAAWRETEARRRDRPRSHVISDEAIMLLPVVSPRAKRPKKHPRPAATRHRSHTGARTERIKCLTANARSDHGGGGAWTMTP